MANIAIIGAGMAGLSAARQLVDDHTITIFDKSRGISGRMSTRYAGDYEFDHGAQFFTAKSPEFQDCTEQAIEQGYVAPWDARAVYKKASGLEPDTGAPRFAAIPRMNSWLKAIGADLEAKGATLHKDRRVTGLSQTDSWELSFEDADSLSGFDHIIMAVPSPQAADLLPENFKGRELVAATPMNACFALMIALPETHDFGWDSLRSDNEITNWVAVNSNKPGRPNSVTQLMIHSAPDWSNTHAEADRDWVQAEMEKTASEIIGYDLSGAPHKAMHRWLYASGHNDNIDAYIHEEALAITVCGDWCHGGRVEGAFLSGLKAARELTDC